MNTDLNRPFNVLFLCTGNSARSIIAEAIMNRVGARQVQGLFGRLACPTGEVNPHALALLKRLHHQHRGLALQALGRVLARPPDAPELDFVFTVCDNAAGEVCPIWPGQPMTAHWGMPDPPRSRATRRRSPWRSPTPTAMLEQPHQPVREPAAASLDRLSLQKRLERDRQRRGQPRPTALTRI